MTNRSLLLLGPFPHRRRNARIRRRFISLQPRDMVRGGWEFRFPWSIARAFDRRCARRANFVSKVARRIVCLFSILNIPYRIDHGARCLLVTQLWNWILLLIPSLLCAAAAYAWFRYTLWMPTSRACGWIMPNWICFWNKPPIARPLPRLSLRWRSDLVSFFDNGSDLSFRFNFSWIGYYIRGSVRKASKKTHLHRCAEMKFVPSLDRDNRLFILYSIQIHVCKAPLVVDRDSLWHSLLNFKKLEQRYTFPILRFHVSLWGKIFNFYFNVRLHPHFGRPIVLSAVFKIPRLISNC